jgi:hypothetical protein
VTSEGEQPLSREDKPAPSDSAATSDGDGGQMLMSPPRPVYGPPTKLPGDRIPGLKGAITIAPVSASVAVPNADHAIGIAQPALRTCYQTGLRREPEMTGTLKVTISVDATGAVTNVATDGPLAAPVQECMKARLKLIKFDAPGSASTLTTQFTCTSTHD